MPAEQLSKDTSPIVAEFTIDDPVYSFFHFTLLIFTVYGQTTPGFEPEKFDGLFEADEYIASLQDLMQKFTEPKTKKIALTIMNCATLLSNIHMLRNELSGPGKDKFKAEVKSKLPTVGVNWDKVYLEEANTISEGFKDTFKKMPGFQVLMDRIAGKKPAGD